MSSAIQSAAQSTISINDGQITTTSLAIANNFGKDHKDVLKKIDNLECSSNFRSANFCAYLKRHESNGQEYRAYKITRDGFVFLVMGFTGKKAAEWKEAYIIAFNEMEKALIDTMIPTTLTPAQQSKIREMVGAKALGERSKYVKLYSNLKKHFEVAKYDQIPSSKFEEALELIEKTELGEFLPKDEPENALKEELPKVDFPKETLLADYQQTDVLEQTLGTFLTAEGLLTQSARSPLRQLITTLKLNGSNVEGVELEANALYFFLENFSRFVDDQSAALENSLKVIKKLSNNVNNNGFYIANKTVH